MWVKKIPAGSGRGEVFTCASARHAHSSAASEDHAHVCVEGKAARLYGQTTPGAGGVLRVRVGAGDSAGYRKY